MEKRLSAALVASAGGFLRNPIRRDHVTCAVCTTPIEERYSLCFPCKQHRLHIGTADIVAPVTYAVALQQSGYIMRGYKARPRVDAHYRLVGMLTVLALSKHGACAGMIAGCPVTHWASIPSLPARPGEHPFHRIVSGSAPGVEVKLSAAVRPSDARAVSANHFTAGVTLPPRSHVLLLDDTWARGGHAQSAALSLRRAGAERVSTLVAARWIKRNYADNARFLDGLPDYDPDVCPWTGGTCPT
ncbi:amidophosphoribosyltransferase [Actinomadura sp. 6K520]|uniref:amidophosphoribosyltransferase n=1 Tax=Actinomadura sp. 6K520 TaxID=2530364 RepID=UPI00104FE05F|nr:amidophosphoribosyltransferase [Actinomadura sp. 6K520]TDE30992.1 amidophosphoribosyltransferase [Actinomadura sp. 6K520]